MLSWRDSSVFFINFRYIYIYILPNSAESAITPHSYTMNAGHSRQPESTNAYILGGGGLASLAAAAHLIHDAHIPPSQIHVLESRPPPARSLNRIGTPDTGYIMPGRQMLSFSYKCLYDLLSSNPSLSNPEKTVMQPPPS